MIGWTIHEVATACRLTEHEISAWISRGHFKPSANVQSGQRRWFDWRDLARLAVVSALRERSILMGSIAQIIADLRVELDRMDGIAASAGLHFFCADWSDPRVKPTVGLVNNLQIGEVLQSGPTTIIVVDVAKIFHDAVGRISGHTIRPPQKTPSDETDGVRNTSNGQPQME